MPRISPQPSRSPDIWSPISAEYTPEVGPYSDSASFMCRVEEATGALKILPLGTLPGYRLEYVISRPYRDLSVLPLRKVLAYIKTSRGQICGYVRAFIFGPILFPQAWHGVIRRSEGLSADLHSALTFLRSKHKSTELLDHAIQGKAIFHLDMFEVSGGHQGKGLGATAMGELIGLLKKEFPLALLTYRPFPFQFLESEPAQCGLSHDPDAVEVYLQFIQASANLSRYYAKLWRGQRLPGTEYFVAPLGPEVELAFNPAKEQWALLGT